MKNERNAIFDNIPKEIGDENVKILFVTQIPSPIGDMIAVADDDFLYLLEFSDGKKTFSRIENIQHKTSKQLLLKDNALLSKLKKNMKSYFNGAIKSFDIPLKFFGTDFQKETWNELCNVKFGKTLSYGELASRLGKSSAHSRAIGACAGANPIVIIIPCHRLIAAHGKLGGFSCGGYRKGFLLDHEKKFK